MLEKTVSGITLIVLLVNTLNLAFSAQSVENRVGSTSYPWLMFHYDPAHTGFTLSSAPIINETLWFFDTGERVTTSPAISDGMVFIGSMDDVVYALNQSNGDLIWKTQLDRDIFFGSPAVDDERLYITATSWSGDQIPYGAVYALNKKTGQILWVTGVEEFCEFSSPNVLDGMVYVGSYNGVYALNCQTGAIVWHYSIEVASSVAIADNMVFVSTWGSTDGSYILALQKDSGKLIWSSHLEGMAGSFVGSPVVADGKVFVPVITSDLEYGFIYTLDEFSGTLIWKSIRMGAIFSTPAVAYGKLFIGSYDGNLYTFNQTNGDLIWTYTTGDSIQSSPAVASGMVFVGSDDNYLYCLKEENGDVIWKYKTGHWICSSPAISDGVVYVGSLDGKLYAIGGIIATLDFKPNTMNLKSKGKWIIAYIELPENYSISNVNISSIMLNKTIPVDLDAPMEIGDYDNDTVPDLMVCFNWTKVTDYILSEGIIYGNITLTISGKLYDGTVFVGSDIILVSSLLGDVNVDGKVDIKDLSIATLAFGETLERPRWNPQADINGDGVVNIRDITLIAKNFGKTYKE